MGNVRASSGWVVGLRLVVWVIFQISVDGQTKVENFVESLSAGKGKITLPDLGWPAAGSLPGCPNAAAGTQFYYGAYLYN